MELELSLVFPSPGGVLLKSVCGSEDGFLARISLRLLMGPSGMLRFKTRRFGVTPSFPCYPIKSSTTSQNDIVIGEVILSASTLRESQSQPQASWCKLGSPANPTTTVAMLTQEVDRNKKDDSAGEVRITVQYVPGELHHDPMVCLQNQKYQVDPLLSRREPGQNRNPLNKDPPLRAI